tara:strand:+ start:450 stop:1109 length:660 start_codon:yes stop_codon:yes gene_type:complete
MPNKYYPVYLDLEKRDCIVIGSNHEAITKIAGLLESKAKVTVIAPRLGPSLKTFADDGIIKWIPRNYEYGDLEGCFLVIVADTSDTETNLKVTWEANQHNVICNVMDVTHMCSFIAPAIARRGEIALAVSTGGASPALARKFREALSESAILEWADIAPLLADVRKELKTRHMRIAPDWWQQCLTEELLSTYQSGNYAQARENLIAALISKNPSVSESL